MFLIQCILVSMVHVLSILDGRILGQNLLNTPIVEATLVGLICGDVQTGLVMGATLQLIFMGFVGIGVTSLPNSSAGTILAVAFAIMSHLSADSAIALSMPIALLFPSPAASFRGSSTTSGIQSATRRRSAATSRQLNGITGWASSSLPSSTLFRCS